MTIEATIQTTLAALASGRCFPLVAPDPIAKPYIVFQIVSEVPANSLDGFSGLSQKRVQVDLYSTTYGGVKALAAAVVTAMATTLPASVHLLSQDLYEDETQLYRVTTDFSLWD